MRRRCFILFALAITWLGFAQPCAAQGTIAYHRPDTPITLFTFGFGQQHTLDMDGDADAELTFSYDFHFIGVRSEQATRVLTNMDPPPNVGGSVAPLPFDYSIGSSSAGGSLQWLGRIPGAPYETDFNTLVQCFDAGCTGDFRGQHAYMGIEFQRATGTHYGWVLLQISSVAPAGQIEAWAWETRPGVPMFAGAVPEPSTVALLLAGGVLMVWLRRYRNETKG